MPLRVGYRPPDRSVEHVRLVACYYSSRRTRSSAPWRWALCLVAMCTYVHTMHEGSPEAGGRDRGGDSWLKAVVTAAATSSRIRTRTAVSVRGLAPSLDAARGESARSSAILREGGLGR